MSWCLLKFSSRLNDDKYRWCKVHVLGDEVPFRLQCPVLKDDWIDKPSRKASQNIQVSIWIHTNKSEEYVYWKICSIHPLNLNKIALKRMKMNLRNKEESWSEYSFSVAVWFWVFTICLDLSDIKLRIITVRLGVLTRPVNFVAAQAQIAHLKKYILI